MVEVSYLLCVYAQGGSTFKDIVMRKQRLTETAISRAEECSAKRNTWRFQREPEEKTKEQVHVLEQEQILEQLGWNVL